MTYSALIPAFNAAETIGETLESVLVQSMPPAETIVVNDGSTDDTASIAGSFGSRVRVVSQARGGVGSATTRAIAIASSPFVAFSDSDDVWLPEKMSVQLSYLDQETGCAGVFGHVRTFRSDGLSAGSGQVSAGWTRTAMVIRTGAARRVGPLIDPPGGRGDTIDWIARAREMGLKLDMLPEVLALRRIRPGSLSYQRDAELDKGYAKVAWLAIQRRKQEPGS